MKYLIFLPAAALICLLPGLVFCIAALRRRRPRPGKGGGPKSFRMERDWLKAAPQQNVYIRSRDGLNLRARLIENGENRRFAILCHGYRAHSASMAGYAKGFFERGWSVLLPDARAHGESEGRWIGMGWPERLDLLDWVAELNRRYAAPEIALMGVSMGGATVMNAAGEALPENVRCVIAAGRVDLAASRRPPSARMAVSALRRAAVPPAGGLFAAARRRRLRAALPLPSARAVYPRRKRSLRAAGDARSRLRGGGGAEAKLSRPRRGARGERLRRPRRLLGADRRLSGPLGIVYPPELDAGGAR